MSYAVIDLETTGLCPWRNDPLQIAAVIANDKFEQIGEFNEYIRPNNWEHWSEGAEKVHGITRDNAKIFPSSIDIINRFIKYLYGLESNGGYTFVCHALPFKSSIDLFDRNFVFSWFWIHDYRADYYRLFPEDKIMSTISRKRIDAHNKWSIKDQKLSTWAKKLGIKFNHHSAIDDAKVCLEILKYQLNSWD